MTTERLRRGLHRIIGVVCACGGELRIESHNYSGERLSNDAQFLWETYCTKCLTCDPNGWPTLAEALANAEEYFNGKVVT